MKWVSRARRDAFTGAIRRPPGESSHLPMAGVRKTAELERALRVQLPCSPPTRRGPRERVPAFMCERHAPGAVEAPLPYLEACRLARIWVSLRANGVDAWKSRS